MKALVNEILAQPVTTGTSAPEKIDASAKQNVQSVVTAASTQEVELQKAANTADNTQPQPRTSVPVISYSKFAVPVIVTITVAVCAAIGYKCWSKKVDAYEDTIPPDAIISQ